MRRAPRWAVAAAVTLLVSCEEATPPEPPVATPGWLAVRLVTPNGDDGGVLFRLRGGPIDSVRAAHPDAFATPEDAESWRVIVAGSLQSGTVAWLWVPDVDAAAEYTAELEQVASGTTYEQRPLAGYQLTVVGPGYQLAVVRP